MTGTHDRKASSSYRPLEEGRRPGAAFPMALLLLAAAACARAPEAPTHRKLLETAAEAVLDPGSISATHVLRTVELPGRTMPDPPDANPPLAIVPLEGIGDELRTVEVEVGDMSRGQLRLDWTTPSTGEPCGLIGQAEHAQVLPDSFRLFRFDLADAPCWEPATERLVLATGQKHRARVVPRVLRLLARQIDPQRVDGRSFGVSIGDELRNAALLSAGHPWRTSAKVFRGAELRFGLGIKGPSPEIRFTLSARRLPEGPAVDLETYSCPEHECRERWVDHVVALDQLEPGDWEISVSNDLETNSRATAFLATPEIVAPTARATAERPNIVLVIIDTLRADHLGTYGYPLPTSPNIDRWARERGVVFEQAIAAAPTTLPSHASMFTGLDALRHGANHEPVSPELTLVAERLRAAGYSTAAATGGGFLHPRYNLFQGFDRYRYFLAGHLREDELASNLPAVLEWIDTLPQPYFVLLHTYEVHSPYKVRNEHLELLGGGEHFAGVTLVDVDPPIAQGGGRITRPPSFRSIGGPAGEPPEVVPVAAAIAAYDSSIRAVDEALGHLLERISSPAGSATAPTAVLITSDHGEAFGEHDRAGHGYLSDDNLLVPLIISWPKGEPGRSQSQTHGIDLTPTLLAIAGVGLDEELNGRSLLPLAVGSPEPPSAAISWAANSNHGIALRLGRRAVYWRQDSVTAEDHGQWSLAGGDGTASHTDAIADRAFSTLRGLWPEAAGLHVEVIAKEPQSVWFAGTLAASTKVKSLDHVRGTHDSEGLRIDLTPDQAAGLLFEGPFVGNLEIATESGQRLVLSADDLDASGTLELHCTDRGCAGDAEESTELVLRMFRVGPQAGATTLTDDELTKQLQALGYLR